LTYNITHAGIVTSWHNET